MAAMLAYSLFTLSALHAVFMGYAERKLHQRALTKSLASLPPLLTMEALLFRMIVVAFSLLTVALISGSIYSEEIFGKPLTFDHKTLFAFISWAFCSTAGRPPRMGLARENCPALDDGGIHGAPARLHRQPLRPRNRSQAGLSAPVALQTGALRSIIGHLTAYVPNRPSAPMAANPQQAPLSGLARALVQAGRLKEAEAEALLAQAAASGISFIEQAASSKKMTALQIATFASETFGYPLFDLSTFDDAHIPANAIDRKLIGTHKVIPLHKRGNRLAIATADPTNLRALDEIRFQTSMAVDRWSSKSPNCCRS